MHGKGTDNVGAMNVLELKNSITKPMHDTHTYQVQLNKSGVTT